MGRSTDDDDNDSPTIKRTKLDNDEDNIIDDNVEEVEDNEIVVKRNDESELEVKCGISERINKIMLINGIVKCSFHDFIVNEIDLKGNVAQLTNFDVPEVEDKKATDDNVNLKLDEWNSKVKNVIEDEEMYKKFIEFFGDQDLSKVLKMPAPNDKANRKLIHDYVKANFKKYTTNTLNEADGKQFIEIKRAASGRGPGDFYRNDKKSLFKYTKCIMYKENIDTMQAINLIAKHMRINAKRIGYAGTKDKRGKTTQYLTFFKMEPKHIARLNNQFHNIKLGNFELIRDEKDPGLRLGDLAGNRFTIVIREAAVCSDVKTTLDDSLKEAAESLRSLGFINYFGLQRFGNCQETPTHHIGKFLILNKVDEAINLILKPRSSAEFNEREEIKRARQVWSEGNVEQALTLVEKLNCIEKHLLQGLYRMGTSNYLGAFQHLPRNMRLMYLHAYQSYVWNCAASKRIQVYGLKPQPGDLVRRHETDTAVLVLNEVNVHEYGIQDVVLPLPGHNVIYPENEIKKFYEELMLKDGISIKDGFKNKIKDFSLSGDYRNLVVQPQQVEYEIKAYKNSDRETDLVSLEQSSQGDKADTRAIILKFNLPSSSYATMTLREILK